MSYCFSQCNNLCPCACIFDHIIHFLHFVLINQIENSICFNLLIRSSIFRLFLLIRLNAVLNIDISWWDTIDAFSCWHNCSDHIRSFQDQRLKWICRWTASYTFCFCAQLNCSHLECSKSINTIFETFERLVIAQYECLWMKDLGYLFFATHLSWNSFCYGKSAELQFFILAYWWRNYFMRHLGVSPIASQAQRTAQRHRVEWNKGTVGRSMLGNFNSSIRESD